MTTLKFEAFVIPRDFEFKLRQQIVSGGEELLVFAVEGSKGLIRPIKEEMLIGPGFRDYVIRIKISGKAEAEKLAFRTVTGWANASHMIVSVREL